ncbi:MAG TPA: methyltransferase domain-containing protein [Bacteroidales bacterium]|nr:methyltransferase domain-containing protein [Bacteroidales bacterium]
MNDFWDSRYNVSDYVYGTKPNQFFRDKLKHEEPGRLLLAGEGEGRNAVYAAMLGWDVYAFDFSMVAKKKALELAFLRGVSINYQVCSWQDYQVNGHTYDMAGLFFFHLPPDERMVFHRRISNWVKPGGTIIAEVFSKKQIERDSGGPKNPDMLYSPEILRKDFRQLNINILRETQVDLDEGSFHQGKAQVVRMEATVSE